ILQQEVRAGDVVSIRLELVADLFVLVPVEPDHDKLLRFLDDAGIVEDRAVPGAVRAPLRVEDEAHRLLLGLRLLDPLVVWEPLDSRVVPVAARDRHGHRGERAQRDQSPASPATLRRWHASSFFPWTSCAPTPLTPSRGGAPSSVSSSSDSGCSTWSVASRAEAAPRSPGRIP